MKIGYTAPDSVRDFIASIGRTEDVRFSPNNRRLAVAAFNRSRIAIFDIDIVASSAAKEVTLTGVVEFTSSCLNLPHGLDFIDDESLVVASRKGDVAIFKLPPAGIAGQPYELSPIQLLRADQDSLLRSPGSVCVVGKDQVLCELLVCNNSGHSVTGHLVNRGAGCSVTSGKLLLTKWLSLPDGLCVSRDRQWLAVSNHNTHGVLLYERSRALDEHAKPDGVLRGAYFPHGLRFSSDGRFLFVADAGAPFVHVYASEGQGWRGTRSPVASFRVMEESVFLRGRQNPQEGGPKGIDIDGGMNVLVATSEHQPLVFFDLPAILDGISGGSQVMDVQYEFGILEQAERLQMRAIQAEARAAKAEAQARRAGKRKSWRITAALRRAYSALRGQN